MMRALWTAASGMIAQQTNVDTISNNLANINTTGYKRETVEFKSLLYQTIQAHGTNSEGEAKPTGIQVGLGVRNSAITSQFTQGSMLETGNDYDFAIDGSAFFMIQMPDGRTGYTRNGSFYMNIGNEGTTLTTSDGYPVLSSTGEPIVLDETISMDKVNIDEFGNFTYLDNTNNPQNMGVKIGLVQFNNPGGLQKMSSSLLLESVASGTPKNEANGETFTISKLKAKYIEGSNVQTVDEMVSLIVAQRAYEMNSKAITASDEMLQQANNLKR